MAGKPIPIPTANAMIGEYVAYLQTLKVDPAKKTQYVDFSVPELMDWLNKVAPYSDEIRVCMGVYPATSPNAGQVTTIIWPYKDGKPAAQPLQGKDGGGGDPGFNPYNEGTSGP